MDLAFAIVELYESCKNDSLVTVYKNTHTEHSLARQQLIKQVKLLHAYMSLYRVSQEECARLWEGVPYVKVYRYNPKHLCPKLTEIMAREKCGLLAGPRTVPVSWQPYPRSSLSVVSYYSNSAHARNKLFMYFLLGDKAVQVRAWHSCHV